MKQRLRSLTTNRETGDTMQISNRLKITAITTILGIALTACATTQQTGAIDKERMLAAAGF